MTQPFRPKQRFHFVVDGSVYFPTWAEIVAIQAGGALWNSCNHQFLCGLTETVARLVAQPTLTTVELPESYWNKVACPCCRSTYPWYVSLTPITRGFQLGYTFQREYFRLPLRHQFQLA